MDELVEEARLAYACFADDRRDLSMSGRGDHQRAAELFQLGIAADQPRQPPSGAHLQSVSRRASLRHFINVDGIGESLHLQGAEALHADVAFRQPEGIGRCQHGAGICHLLHPSRQVHGRPHDCVVRVEVVTDVTDNNLP